MPTQTNLTVAKLMSIDQVQTILRTKLEDEARILDSLVAEAVEGRPNVALWKSFNEAAQRDDLLPEVAFAYEQLVRSKRLKSAPNTVQADVLMHAARFFGEMFGDGEGATEFLERVVALQPDHSEAIPQLERVLIAAPNRPALADLYEKTAPARAEPKERIALLTRAAELLDRNPAESEHVIRIYEHLLEIEPNQPRVRRALETRYLLAGRPGDAAAFLEKVLSAEHPPDEAEAFAMRTRLMGLYAGELGDVEQALPHIEALLAKDPSHEKARLVALQLLERATTRGRASELLADVFHRLGSPVEASNMLAVRLGEVDGPERAPLERKLAILKCDVGDLAGAHPLLEAVVLRDPTDDDVRRRFREVSASLDRRLAAADTLALAASSTDDLVLRARLSMELGEVLMDAGDVGRARAALQEVIELKSDDALTLAAARELVGLYAIAREHRALASVLELLAEHETEEAAREAAIERAAHLYEADLDDPAAAIVAWRKLLAGARAEQAQASLQALFERAGAVDDLADVLEQRAKATSGPEARLLGFRAAEIRAARAPERPVASLDRDTTDGDTLVGPDTAHALAVWRAFLAEYGPDRNAHARLGPLLEQEELWAELAEMLTAEIALAPPPDRAPYMARLARLHVDHLGDRVRAVQLAAEALLVDPKELEARTILEAELDAGDHRLAAADALDPVYRAAASTPDLVRVLRVKGELATKPTQRLGAFEEAVTLAERELGDIKLALDLAGLALVEAVAREPKRTTSWLDRVERLASAAGDSAKKAELLVAALAARTIDSKAMARLGRRAGAALEAIGDIDRAIDAYQNALKFEPSPELEKRVQKLLMERKTPEERIAAFRTDLGSATDPARRRDALAHIATIERDERKDLDASIATWRELLVESPKDAGAHEALLLAYTALGDAEARLDVARGLAVIEAEKNDHAGAFALFENVVLQRPNDAEARARLRAIGAAIGKSGDAARAIQQAAERIEVAEERARLTAEAGLALRDAGDADAARDVLQGVVDANVDGGVVLEAARALVALYTRPTDRSALASTLELLGRVEPDAADRLASAERRAALASSPSEAADAWRAFKPNHPNARVPLAHIVQQLERAERWSDLADALEEDAGHAASSERAALLGRAAELRRGRLGEMTRAFVLYQRALEADPVEPQSRGALAELLAAGDHRAEAADVLEPFVRAEGDPKTIADLLAVRAAATADAEGRLAAIAEALSVLELDPTAAKRALDMAVLGLRLAPSADRAGWLDRVERIARGVPASDRAAILEAALGGADVASPELARLARVVAEAFEAAGELDRALALYQRVLEATPSSLELKVRVYGVMMNRAEQTLGSREAAVTHVAKHVLALPADEMDGALAIALLLPAVDGVEGTLASLRSLRARSEGALGVALDVIVAEVGLKRLGRHDEALDLIESLIAAYPDDRAPLPVLGRAIALEASRERATALVERAAEAAGDPGRAVALLERLSAAYPIEPHAERVAAWEALCDRFESRAEVALGLAVRAVETLPDEDRLWDRAERLARALDRPGPVADAYERILGARFDAAVLQKVGRRAVDFFEEWFDDDRPLRLLAKLLKADAEWAFERLKLALSSSARWDDLFRLYDERLAEAADDAARAAVLEEASQVARDFAGDAARAIGYLERLAALRPGDARVDAALERLYEREVLRPELIALLSARLAGMEGNDAQLLRARIAGLWLDCGDEGAGFERAFEMLALEADRAEAFELLERVVLRDRTKDGDEGATIKPLSVELLRRGAALLRTRYATDKRTKDLVRAVTVELGTAADDAERIVKHRELADLKLELVDYAGAFGDVAALVALETHREEHVDQLADLAGALDHHARFAEILVGAAELAPAARDQARLIARAAVVARDKQSDPVRAIELFTRVLGLAKDDGDRLLSTARELEPLLNVAGMDAERCSVLETIAALEQNPTARRDAFGQVARIAADLLKDEPRAVSAWRARLADDATDREALDGLAGVLESSKRHQELIEILDRRAEIADKRQAKQDRIQIAKIHLEELSAVADGISAWQRVRDVFGPDEENFTALAGLLELETRWSDLAKLLEHQADNASDKARAVELFRRLGDLERDRIVHVGRAAAAYRAALVRDPRDQGSRSGLASLLESPEVRDETIDALSRAYADTGDWEHAATLSRDLKGPEDVPSDLARSFWWGVALHYRDAKSDPDAAEWAFGRALAHDAHSEEVLTSLANVQRRAPGRSLIDTLLRLSDVKGGDLDLLQEAADVAIHPLADREMSMQSCEKLLDLAVSRWTDASSPTPARREGKKKRLAELVDAKAPRSVAAWSIEQLVRMGLESGDHRRIVALYQRGAGLPFERTETRRMRREAALACERELADQAGAIALYGELFAEDPADEIAQQSVETFASLLEKAERHADVVALWEQQARCRADADDRPHAAELWARAAELAEQRLADVERAILDHGRGADLGGVPSLEALARIHDARREHLRAAEALERICERAAPDSLAADTLRLAEAYVLAGDRPAARERASSAAADVVADGRPLRARLAELYREDQLWDPLAALFTVEGRSRRDARRSTFVPAPGDRAPPLQARRRGRFDPAPRAGGERSARRRGPRAHPRRVALRACPFRRVDQGARGTARALWSRKPKERALTHYARARRPGVRRQEARARGARPRRADRSFARGRAPRDGAARDRARRLSAGRALVPGAPALAAASGGGRRAARLPRAH